jgi:hypothetical protein
MFAEHDKVEVPDAPPIDVDERLHDMLVEFDVAARVTVPVNPFKGDTEIVDVPGALVVGETLVGVAATAKSWT